jgi:PTS system nitrogen regulatory IIA component
MNISELLSSNLTFCNVPGTSKKRLLETSAELIAGQIPQTNAGQIYEALIAREQLGSTGIGGGIAIPHCRVARLENTVGCLLKLQQPIDFDAIDKQPVDLLFVLLAPENTQAGHLQALKVIAEHFSNSDYCKRLRAATSNEELHAAAISLPGH